MNKEEKLAAGCKNCGTPFEIGRARLASGSTVYPYFCGHCGQVTTIYEKKAVAESRGKLRDVETNSARKGFSNPPCERCGAEGTENHHWAPSALFGSEADDWPTSFLCVPCHTRWHQLVTPKMTSIA